jgi:hypothetical protein
MNEEIRGLIASRAGTSTVITIRRGRRAARGARRAHSTPKIRYTLYGMHKRIGSPPMTRTLTMSATAAALARKAHTEHQVMVVWPAPAGSTIRRKVRHRARPVRQTPTTICQRATVVACKNVRHAQEVITTKWTALQTKRGLQVSSATKHVQLAVTVTIITKIIRALTVRPENIPMRSLEYMAAKFARQATMQTNSNKARAHRAPREGTAWPHTR